MTDHRMKDRVKVMLAGTTPEGETSEHAFVGPHAGGLPNQALHVLTLAQRTAEEHVATAHQQAEKIRADALANADQIARDAQVHAHDVRVEADKVLAEARAAADQTVREGQAHADEVRRTAEKILSEARARAEAVVADARANADQLKQQAQQRYDDVVGSLGTKRESLQQQIEALERFDHEYRARLTAFMQGQLRALWLDQPAVTAELPDAEDPDGREPAAEHEDRDDPEQYADEEQPQAHIPAQRPAEEDEPQPVGAHAKEG